MPLYQILEVTPEANTWSNEHGEFRTYRLKLEGQAKTAHLNQKSNTAAPQVGASLDLDLTPHPRFPDDLRAKKVQTNGGGGRGGGKSIEERRSIAMQASQKVAVDVVRIAVDAGLWKPETPEGVAAAVRKVAGELYGQVNEVSA